MNRLVVSCVLACTIVTCNHTHAEEIPSDQTLLHAPEYELLKISGDNILVNVTAYIASLCQEKGFSFSQIPEDLHVEAETRVNDIIHKLTKIMQTDNRSFVYQYEIEAVTKKNMIFFLTRVYSVLLTQMGEELLKNLTISSETKKSSKLVIPQAIREKIDQSKLVKK